MSKKPIAKIVFFLLFIAVIVTIAWVFAFSWKTKRFNDEQGATRTDRFSGSSADANPGKKTISPEPAPDKIAGSASSTQDSADNANASEASKSIKVVNLREGDLVKSPLIIDGEARGDWYFEGIFPVRLLDSQDRPVAEGQAQVLGDWMTDDFTAFNLSLKFQPPATATGTLIFKKANPSGLPAHSEEMRLMVRFK